MYVYYNDSRNKKCKKIFRTTSVIIPSGLIKTSRDRDRETKRVREIVG